MVNKVTKMPVLFVGHGSPMNAALDNAYTRSLRALGEDLPRPAAVLVVSAHWLTEGTYICCADRPQQIYDFYGFPDELYRITYRPAGAPDLARAAAQRLKPESVNCDTAWGLDHAAWAVLLHMYPRADIPVLEMSLDIGKPARHHYEIGKQLSFLRRQGVLVMGSGNIVHNLQRMKYDMDDEPFAWAVEFDAYARDCLIAGDHQGLIDPAPAGRAAQLAIPTNDHYLPLLYVIALQETGEQATFFHEGIQHGSVSMRGLVIS
jgi:4,5-DOPA dioxygenase extradiol